MAGRTVNLVDSKKNYTKREKNERKHLKTLLEEIPNIENDNHYNENAIIQSLDTEELSYEEKFNVIVNSIINIINESKLDEIKELDIINLKSYVNVVLMLDRLEKSISTEPTKTRNAKGELKANPDIDSYMKYQTTHQKLANQLGMSAEQRTRILKLTAQLMADEEELEEDDTPTIDRHNPLAILTSATNININT